MYEFASVCVCAYSTKLGLSSTLVICQNCHYVCGKGTGERRNAFRGELFPHLLITGTEESVQPVVDVAVIVETIDIKHRPTAQNSGHSPHCRQLLFTPRLLFVQSDSSQKRHHAKIQYVKMHHATTQKWRTQKFWPAQFRTRNLIKAPPSKIESRSEIAFYASSTAKNSTSTISASLVQWYFSLMLLRHDMSLIVNRILPVL